MQWFNLHIPLLKSDEFLDAELWEIGVWIRLMCYCCEQENGGKILGCSDWSDKKWLLACSIQKSDLERPSKLWTWASAQPGVLWVHSYPGSVEDQVRKNRYAGKKGGSRTSKVKEASARENGQKGGRPVRYGNSNNPSITQRKGKGKDKVIPVAFDDPELSVDAGEQEMR